MGRRSLLPVESHRLAERRRRLLRARAVEVERDEGDGLQPRAHDREGDDETAFMDAEPSRGTRAEGPDNERGERRGDTHGNLRERPSRGAPYSGIHSIRALAERKKGLSGE